jgi:hypothetical protein
MEQPAQYSQISIVLSKRTHWLILQYLDASNEYQVVLAGALSPFQHSPGLPQLLPLLSIVRDSAHKVGSYTPCRTKEVIIRHRPPHSALSLAQEQYGYC